MAACGLAQEATFWTACRLMLGREELMDLIESEPAPASQVAALDIKGNFLFGRLQPELPQRTPRFVCLCPLSDADACTMQRANLRLLQQTSIHG